MIKSDPSAATPAPTPPASQPGASTKNLNSTADRVAHFVTQRRGLAYALLASLVACAVLVIALRGRIASDVLDLLPQQFDSVKTFKTYDREFSQAHELTFALLDEKHPETLDRFTELFAQMLRGEAWVVRVLERSPMESTEGLDELPALATPLLLNAPDFAQVHNLLTPAAIESRISALRADFEAGSPRAEAELEFDPLGLLAVAMRPLSGSFATAPTRPLSSPDGTLRVVVAVTNQTDLGAHSCQNLMRDVEAFKIRVASQWRENQNTEPPAILVTGRSAYVGELSLTMRRDVVSTIGSSILLVAAMFYLGFRRLPPLISILHVLLICCVLAAAIGVLIFSELNMITIGLCAILIGLGVDFGMVLFGLYQAERIAGRSHQAAIAEAIRHHGRAVIFGALTTACAFLCLIWSGCAGFAQLGVLIACGILFAAFLMMSAFFLGLSPRHVPQKTDHFQDCSLRFLASIMAHPLRWLLAGSTSLGALTLFAVLPIVELRFEANPRTLEPHNSRAGFALRTITTKMPAISEPLIVLVDAPDAQTFHEYWATLAKKWDTLVQDGTLRSVSTPALFALSPDRIRLHTATLSSAEIQSARDTFRRTLNENSLRPDAFAPTFALLDGLEQSTRQAPRSPRDSLSETSPWRFVLDRFFARSPNLGIAYVTPAQPIATFAQKEALRELLSAPGIPLHISGWSYTMSDLVPWAKNKLHDLIILMIALNIALLTYLFRGILPVIFLMTTLTFAFGAMVATLKLCGVTLNLFNVLSFGLVLGVGVDYGIYIAMAARVPFEKLQDTLASLLKPVLLSGLTTVAGFASLLTAQNPALRGLGIVCATGVAWCLFATAFFLLPACVYRARRSK